MEEVNYDHITNGNKELEQKLKILELELEVMSQEGLSVPPASFISTDHWKQLLGFSSRSARLRYYTFLFKTMKKKENEKVSFCKVHYNQTESYITEKENGKSYTICKDKRGEPR